MQRDVFPTDLYTKVLQVQFMAEICSTDVSSCVCCMNTGDIGLNWSTVLGSTGATTCFLSQPEDDEERRSWHWDAERGITVSVCGSCARCGETTKHLFYAPHTQSDVVVHLFVPECPNLHSLSLNSHVKWHFKRLLLRLFLKKLTIKLIELFSSFASEPEFNDYCSNTLFLNLTLLNCLNTSACCFLNNTLWQCNEFCLGTHHKCKGL